MGEEDPRKTTYSAYIDNEYLLTNTAIPSSGTVMYSSNAVYTIPETELVTVYSIGKRNQKLQEVTLTPVLNPTLDIDSTLTELDVVDAPTAKASVSVSGTFNDEDKTFPVSNDFVTYSVTGDAVKVDEKGNITALKAGHATVTATCGTYSDSVEVTVKAPEQVTPDGLTIKYDFAVMNPDGQTLKDLTYSVSNGFWEYAANERKYTSISSETSGVYISVYEKAPLVRSSSSYWLALKLNVPKTDKYNIKLNCEVTNSSNGVVVAPQIYLFEAAKVSSVNDGIISDNMLSTTETIASKEKKVVSFEAEELNAGEYYLVLSSSKTSSETAYPRLAYYDLTLTSGENGLEEGVPMWYSSVGETSLELGNTTSMLLTATKNSDGTDYTAPAASYKSSDSDVASVDAETGLITANKVGSATITATAGDIEKTAKITVSDKAVSGSVNFYVATEAGEPTVEATGYDGSTGINTLPVGTAVTVTADTSDANYIFRGWKRGSAERGVWLTSEETLSFNLVSNTMLTAVYDEANEATENEVTVEFYNGNGQFMERATATKNVTTFSALSAPTATLTGFEFDFWSIEKENDVAVAIDPATTFEKLTRVVAQFKNKTTDNFTVNGNPGYKYNEAIEFNSDDGEAVLWYVNDKPVAYGESYTYHVWSNATVRYEDEATTGPILSIAQETVDGAYMISFDGNGKEIVEVGIVFGGDLTGCQNRASSAKKGDVSGQFTASYNAGVPARGYLIYKDGNKNRVVYTD